MVKARKYRYVCLQEDPINRKVSVGGAWKKTKRLFVKASGGKTVFRVKVAAIAIGIPLATLFLVVSFLGKKPDSTSYVHTTGSLPESRAGSGPTSLSRQKPVVESHLRALFQRGQKRKETEEKVAAQAKRTRIAIRYSAPQVLGASGKMATNLRAGSKLIGVLITSIDSRQPSRVRVRLLRGTESNGVSLEKDSILNGQFSYSGVGDRLQLTFGSVDPPGGEEPRKIAALALDVSDYSSGVRGDTYSGTGLKIATNLGLSLASGMADTMTERESLGNSFNGVQAKPSMKNGILQGASQAARNEVGRRGSEFQSIPAYVLLPAGTEMIIELEEDFKNDK